MKKTYLLLVLVLFIASCTTDIPQSPDVDWGKYTIHLESRPPIIEKGMVELLTVVDYEKNFRGWDLVIYYRIGPMGRWIQAIQDGHTGVYRRAMRVNDPATDVLYMHVKRNQTPEEREKKLARKEVVLQFPLSYSTALPSEPAP